MDDSENEDVFELLDKFKRAATLNGWKDDDLPIGLPLYLKGHASAWFKCCLLYTSPSPRDGLLSRMPSSA